jgi:hypothetical protein
MDQVKRFFRVVNGDLTEYVLLAIIVLLTLISGTASAEEAAATEAAPLLPEGITWQLLGMIAFLAAPISMGITQGGKKALSKLNPDCPGDPLWWQWGLRALSVLIGAGVGMALLPSAMAWGAAAGGCGGALSSVIVATLRKQIRTVSAPPEE